MGRARGWLVVVSALVALGCGGPSGEAVTTDDVGVRAAVTPEATTTTGAAAGTHGEGEPSAPAAAASADAPDASALDALPWAERIPLERALRWIS